MDKFHDWGKRHLQFTAAKNADQAELEAIRYGSCNLEAGINDDRTAGAMDDYDVPDPKGVAAWAETDAQYDTATGAISEEVIRRASILGNKYPFELDGNKIVYEQSLSLAYEFCLAVSEAPSLSAGELKRLPIAFERLARDIVKCYLGPGAAAYRTGWPRDSLEPRPLRFKALVKKLNLLTGEWHWQPSLGLPDDPSSTLVRDRGLDFVVWRPMPDGRKGQLFLLGQCACGKDWTDKYHDVDLTKLGDWVRPLSVAPPLRVFTVPFHIPNDADFWEVNERAGLTFDRTRIVLLAEKDENRDSVAHGAKDPFSELIRLVIPGFEVAARVG
jgi:hypothetical protein